MQKDMIFKKDSLLGFQPMTSCLLITDSTRLAICAVVFDLKILCVGVTLLLEKEDDHYHKDKGAESKHLSGPQMVHPIGKFEIVTELWPCAALFSF